MPLAIVVLGFGIFAQGTSELMLAGLIPELSADLHVSVPQAGLLISGFALGMMVGAPVLALATLRWPKRRALLVFTAVFALTHLLAAATDSFAVLLATRFVGAFVYAGFWSVAATTAIALVPADRRGRAMSVVAGGLTLATVIGLPLGTLLGQHAGWRATFVAVAIATAVAGIAIAATVPAEVAPSATALPREEIRALRTGRLWLSYAITAFSIAALLISFGYLGAMLLETAHAAPATVPIVLALYGVGAVAGIAAGGRLADRRPESVLVGGTVALALASAALAATLTHPALAALSATLLGAAGFVTNPALNSRVFALAPGAPTLAPAFTVAAFNAGIAVGPWLGGTLLDLGASYRALPLAGAALAVVAAGLAIADSASARAARRTVDERPRECLTGA
ncbi:MULTISPECIES: Cmx/CmrA family chloramphenicol efflux MFS transporter [Tsukamurella]|uniref:MFS transporter n=2 Tax=Tsukamurella TaxID=2060 RepID=A0A5C5S1B0_9ACTN|nr:MULTISPECIES: Cmx/CmrA family chloramphenicol efflux MFS transporter [Tsukamurella]NMD58252.1 MFS transporter [Tsukamurella columbiensis]TWS28692.1 MFS transporter [Tsukamurella conjunctivitidis]